MSEAKKDGGMGFSGDAVARFVEQWDARNPDRRVLDVRRVPAVAKIPRADGGEMKVWVKSLGHEVNAFFLSRNEAVPGDFLFVAHFCDSERSQFVWRVMSKAEVERARIPRRAGTVLQADVLKAKSLSGPEAWERIESAVLRG